MVAWAVALERSESARVMSRRRMLAGKSLSIMVVHCILDATKAAGACKAALRRPSPPRETGREAKIQRGSEVEIDAPTSRDKALH